MKPDKHFCLDCGWSGDEPASKEYVDIVEFWGQKTRMVTVEEFCPLCGGEVENGQKEESPAA